MAIDRLNYWYYWIIKDNNHEILFPNNKTSRLSGAYRDFYDAVTMNTEDVQDDEEYFKKLKQSKHNRYVNLIKLLRENPIHLKEDEWVRTYFFQLMEAKFRDDMEYSKYYKQAITALKGDKRGRTKISELKEIVERNYNHFIEMKKINISTPSLTIDKIAMKYDQTKELLYWQTYREIYVQHNKVFKALDDIFQNPSITLKCMELMTNIDSHYQDISADFYIVKYS